MKIAFAWVATALSLAFTTVAFGQVPSPNPYPTMAPIREVPDAQRCRRSSGTGTVVGQDASIRRPCEAYSRSTLRGRSGRSPAMLVKRLRRK
jgi:hypothetical protein